MTFEATARRPVARGRGASRLLSDDRLARRAADGDRRAMEEVCARYRQDLYRFCLTMLGDPQDAQDAVQNTFVKVLRALPGEQRRIQLRPWLYRIARNESVELVRGRRDVEPEVEVAAPQQLADAVETRQRLRALIDDLRELPERQRSALMMRELGGLGFGEIGTALEASEGAVRQTIYEARLGLRQMESGREMSCEAVKRELSDADGRVARRRDLRAHLRGCADCQAFRDGMATRRNDLAAISPLPAVASAALLQGVLGGGASATAGSVVAKSAATVAVVAVVGVSAADRGGVIDVPLPGDSGVERQAEPSGTPPAELRAVPGQNAATGGTSEVRDGVPRGSAADGADGRSRDGGAGTRGAGAAPGRMRPADGRRAKEFGAGVTAPRGHGQGKSGQKGRPEGMPAASQPGQETAAGRKSPQSKGVPGGGTTKPRNEPAGQAQVRPESRSQPPEPPAQAPKPQIGSPHAVVPEAQGLPEEAPGTETEAP